MISVNSYTKMYEEIKQSFITPELEMKYDQFYFKIVYIDLNKTSSTSLVSSLHLSHI